MFAIGGDSFLVVMGIFSCTQVGAGRKRGHGPDRRLVRDGGA